MTNTGFDLSGFFKSELETAERLIPVPELSDWMVQSDDGENLELNFKVKNPGAGAISRINDTFEMQLMNRRAALSVLLNENSSLDSRTSEFKKVFDSGSENNETFLRQIGLVSACTFYPADDEWKQVDATLAMKIANNFPNTFYMLYTQANEVIGEGAVKKKLIVSGKEIATN